MGKKKKKKTSATGDASSTSIIFDEDTAVFIDMARAMKEDGNKLFQKRDYDGAMTKYEKAVKLLPKTHADVASLRANMAACFMHAVPPEYHRAVAECDLALDASPRHSKALLKRARCYEQGRSQDFGRGGA